MRTRWAALLAIGALALLPSGEATHAQPGPNAAPEYVTVQLDTGVAARAARAFGGRTPTLKEEGLRQFAVPPGKTREQFVAELSATPGVLAVEAPESGSVHAAFVPNDPYYAAPGENQQAYLGQVNAAGAWDVHQGSRRIVVAVLDSGLDLGHEEFAGRLWENPYDADSDGVDDDHNGCIDDRYGCRFINLTPENISLCGYSQSSTGETAYGDVRDDHAIPGSTSAHSHGTLVAGILGATGNNGRGVAGLAWDVQIMPVKVLDCGRTSVVGGPRGDPFNLAEGINYAVRMGADVINLSLAADKDWVSIRTAVQHAQEAGVLVVTASGNGSGGDMGVGYPAAYLEYPNVVAVGATNNKVSATSWADYSRYGPAVDFAAPANGLFSTARSDLGFATAYFSTGGGGTSFSTPVVTGTFALLMSRNPSLPAADYIQIARDTATPATPASHGQNWAGSGIINAGAAVARVPMLMTGEALHDWMPVPAGTTVRALIDGVECGAAVAQTQNKLAFYSIRIRSAAEQPGCGVAGKGVQLLINGAPAVPLTTWRGPNQSLDIFENVSSVSPPPGAVVVQALNGGWSNIAVLDASGALPNVLSSLSGWNAIYRWNPDATGFTGTGAYDRYARNVPAFVNSMATLATYEAIWVDAPAGNVASLNPNPAGSRTIALKPGWNNFVYTGTNREVKDALAGIPGKYTAVLRYDNAALAWRRHTPGVDRYLNDFGGLFKLQVYWIFVKEPANLTMN